MGGFPCALDSNSCGSNNRAMIIKHYHHVLKPWPQTINVGASSERKAVIIFDGRPLYLNIDLIKELGWGGGWYGMVVPLNMTNTSHKTNVKDMVTFGNCKRQDFKMLKKSYNGASHSRVTPTVSREKDCPHPLKKSLG